MLLLVVTSTSLAQRTVFIDFVNEEYTQMSIWTEPTAWEDSGAQFGVEIKKVMLWGWVSASFSHYSSLDPSYTDLVGAGGVNFNMLGYDQVVYYAGMRLGPMWRETSPYPMVGGIVGFDWRLSRKYSSTKFHVGIKAWIDYREDQKEQFFGDYQTYEPGLVTNNPLLVENGAVALSWSW